MLSRQELVDIFSEAISLTREKIAVKNQIAGYYKYHNEIKEKQAFDFMRTQLCGNDCSMYAHDLIGHMGIGNCNELAQFLLIEISKKIHESGGWGRVSLVSSESADHVFVEIEINLLGEADFSLWQVDAWDPRILDISTRPDGSVKNQEYLAYGYDVCVKGSIFTNEINYEQRYSFFNIRKPVKGRSEREMTPFESVLEKHPTMYDDITIEDAIDKGLFPEVGRLGYLQKRSNWQ